MALPGAIVLRPNEFTQPDYSVVYKDPDGREFGVGRIYHDTTGTVGGATLWFWTVEYHQRQGRAAPGQGQCDTLEEAKAAWRKCWDSADVPIHWPPALQRKPMGEANSRRRNDRLSGLGAQRAEDSE